jgi:hypothetical protein
MISLSFEAGEADNEYDTVISMDNKNSKIAPNPKPIDKPLTEEQSSIYFQSRSKKN